MSRYGESRRGFILMTVLTIMITVSLLVVALTQAISGYASMTERMMKKIQEYYLAEAGLHTAMAMLYDRDSLLLADPGKSLDYSFPVAMPNGTVNTVFITVTNIRSEYWPFEPRLGRKTSSTGHEAMRVLSWCEIK